jgi:hypothetical protein
MSLVRRALVTAVVLVLGLPSLAGAGGDPFSGGALMARGKSPGGIPWRIRAVPSHRSVTFSFLFKEPAYPDAGLFLTMPLPLDDDYVFTADTGSDLSPESEEGDFSGIAVAQVATIRVRMSDGTTLEVLPTRPPDAVRERFAWARRVAAFDVFYDGSIYPVVARAYDREGTLLKKSRSHRGIFPRQRDLDRGFTGR